MPIGVQIFQDIIDDLYALESSGEMLCNVPRSAQKAECEEACANNT